MPRRARKDAGKLAGWRKSFLVEYWAEQAMPWLVGMTYKAVRTDRYKYIHWVNRGSASELDELYDLDRDPYELEESQPQPRVRGSAEKLRRELQEARRRSDRAVTRFFFVSALGLDLGLTFALTFALALAAALRPEGFASFET